MNFSFFIKERKGRAKKNKCGKLKTKNKPIGPSFPEFLFFFKSVISLALNTCKLVLPAPTSQVSRESIRTKPHHVMNQVCGVAT